MLRALQRRRSVLSSLEWRQLCSPGCAIDDGSFRNHEDYAGRNPQRDYRNLWSSKIRRFCVTTEQDVYEPKKAVSAANTVLQQIAVRKLCAKLEEESRSRLTMPVDEALALTQKMVNVNEPDSIDLLRALQTSGNILQHGRQVYLRPQEVAEIILQAIPDTEEEVEVRRSPRLSLREPKMRFKMKLACLMTWSDQSIRMPQHMPSGKAHVLKPDFLQIRCREIEDELRPLQQEFEGTIERKAKLRSAVLAYVGLGLLVAQFAFFVRCLQLSLATTAALIAAI